MLSLSLSGFFTPIGGIPLCLLSSNLDQFGPMASLRPSHQHLFGGPLGHLWSCGHHSVTHLVHLLSFSHKTCLAHQCLMVQILWITSMTLVLKQIQLPACQKKSNQGLFCISTLVLDCDLLAPSDQGRCSCQLLQSSFH